MNKLLIIDNYDSFTFNLVALCEQQNYQATVIRNDDLKSFKQHIYTAQAIIVSPGPSIPQNAKLALDAIDYAAQHTIPLLGVCLGHQAIGYYFGGNVIKAPFPMHGKESHINLTPSILWQNLHNTIQVCRYHSLIIEAKSLPKTLRINSLTIQDNLIMGIEHHNLPIFGIQFHPESIATPFGPMIMNNFLQLAHKPR
ncbi:anthranilate synthase component II [Rickettsiales endosymbiont of Stachyamoeba lipophora]|uniref:anthranilate synthase component II n=1 Tax=Rickettsiales endosymbiont of Stachyamoeba lipophora TaxID=2486578 RepID=UPI000F64CEC1|nr:aminodeoxychorismate/anthranilate synthase component II [Rickettsiales endosymbiont of Stachyamoeba lipophora]AZL15478.1 aminodeoxychorismate/anthranilate synthase component II [Rickettsiales endosymbiont of Stachyamoeba lipophora]